MKKLYKGIAAITLGLSASAAMAGPSYLVTHNNTDVESNAYVANKIPSQHPTKAHSTGKVSWALVKTACYITGQFRKCSAMIKMATDTSNPVELGMVTLNLSTGDITPKTLSANGYSFNYNGPGESTLSQD